MNVNNRSAIQWSAAPWWPGMMPAHKQTMQNLLQRSHRPDPATQRCKAAKIILRRHIIAYAERVRRTNSRQENSIRPTQRSGNKDSKMCSRPLFHSYTYLRHAVRSAAHKHTGCLPLPQLCVIRRAWRNERINKPTDQTNVKTRHPLWPRDGR
jgi:hypothetical protein